MNLITQSKTRSNPESNVALMTLSDLSVLVGLTNDSGKILAKLNQVSFVFFPRNNLIKYFLLGYPKWLHEVYLWNKDRTSMSEAQAGQEPQD